MRAAAGPPPLDARGRSGAAFRKLPAVGLPVAFGGVAAAVSLWAAPDRFGVLGVGLAVLAAWIAAVDARRFIIPDLLTLAVLGLGLLHAALLGAPDTVQAVGYALLRGAVIGLLFLGLREVYRRLRGRNGLGLGDVKLAAAMGVWLDWQTLPIAIEIAALGALAVFGARYVLSRRRIHAGTRVAFGLFLAPAIWLGWLIETALLGV